MLLIDEIKLKEHESEDRLKNKLLKKLHLKEKDLISYKVDKCAIDARDEILYVYRLKIEVKDEDRFYSLPYVRRYERYKDIKKVKSTIRPIIIGDGPSGLFAAVTLVDAGLKPIIFEKGQDVDGRQITVRKFFKEAILDPSCNVQFGEGGAGTFSDAKLTTRIKDPYIEYIIDKFIAYGADPKIAIASHPHIGTDKIIDVIRNMREDLISKGAQFHFSEEVKDFIVERDTIKGVITDKDTYYSDIVILAIGHSAIDTFKALIKHGIYIEAKEFAVGFRVEHPQTLIDHNQYHGHKLKEPAEYFLRHRSQDERGVYSFCMCPGGFVIPSSAKEKTICTNGMSYSKRDNHLANSAILCQIKMSDLDDDLMSGYHYIEDLEKRAYAISGSYRALAQNIKDYIHGGSQDLIFEPSYFLGTTLYDLNHFFDEKLNKAFKEALLAFDKKIEGFIDKGIMIAPETRSSSPFRVKRDARHQSISHHGLYPIGEGAGYAGGIMSSSLDGVKCALDIIEDLS